LTGRDTITDTEKVVSSLVKQVYVWNMPDANLVYSIGVSGLLKEFFSIICRNSKTVWK